MAGLPYRSYRPALTPRHRSQHLPSSLLARHFLCPRPPSPLVANRRRRQSPSQDAPQLPVRGPRVLAPRAAFVPQHPGLVASPISPIPFKMSRLLGIRSHPLPLPLATRKTPSEPVCRHWIRKRSLIVVRHRISALFVRYSRMPISLRRVLSLRCLVLVSRVRAHLPLTCCLVSIRVSLFASPMPPLYLTSPFPPTCLGSYYSACI
ncbi:hypothetical protein EDB85DRAFT_1989541 [Lactarius pseudohatsudake]|nr:hypothetical protein EDB85DRAFT_1989541 [Lactarius pseudohatsudake]